MSQLYPDKDEPDEQQGSTAALEASIQHTVQSTTDPRDEMYSYALPDGAVVRRAEGRGRGVYASKRFKAGAIVLSTLPRTAVLSTAHLQTSCSGCFLTPQEVAIKTGAVVQELKRCQACRTTYYCSVTCQRSDWQTHKPECQAHKALRTAWEAQHPVDVQKKSSRQETPWIMAEAVRGLGRLVWARRRGRTASGKDPAWWAEIESMESHVKRLPVDDLIKLGEQVEILRYYLSCAEAVGGDPPTPADMADYGFTSSGQLLDLVSALKINSFTLSSPSLSPVGLAMSPITALFNHSCRPNAVVVFPNGGGEMRVVAISDIDFGQEILTSYIDVSLPLVLRRKELKERYGFDCNCSLCASGGGAELLTGPEVDQALEILHHEEAGTLGDPEEACRKLSRMFRTSLRHTSPSSYPILALLRLHALLLTPPISPQTHNQAVVTLAQAHSGAEAVYPLGHPTLGIILAEWGKLLAMEKPSEWGQARTIESIRDLQSAVFVLRRAKTMLERGFGPGGGLVGKEVEGLRIGCEGELALLKVSG